MRAEGETKEAMTPVMSRDVRQNNQSGRLTLASNMCAVCDDIGKDPLNMHVVEPEEQHGRSCLSSI